MNKDWTCQTVQFLGTISFSICFLGFIGHITHNPDLYTWGGGAGISLPTAVALGANGCSIFMLGRLIAKLCPT